MRRAVGEYVVRNNPEERRYELVREDELLGEIEYRTERGAIVLVHTEVAPAAEGQGIGSRLIAGALEDVRARGLRIVPQCRFVAGYLERHPEQLDLVAGGDV